MKKAYCYFFPSWHSLGFPVASQHPHQGNVSLGSRLRSQVKRPPFPTTPIPYLPGDFADPSVVKIGDTYWATATSSEWAPLFPLLKSKNLVDWEIVGHIFPDQLPTWADANFWAPEITYENGKVYIYYVGHKKGGSLCVAVASANRPEGPYTDLGPLVCQEVGSIDGFPIRDEKGIYS